MYMSILQLSIKLAENICSRAEKGELQDLDIMASDVLADCKESATDMIRVIIETMNESVRNDKAARKEQGLVLKEKDRPRQILTELGPIDFRRDYYYDKKKDEYTSVLDRMLGIAPYERVGGAVRAKLVTAATECSYARSAETVTGGGVSRQTVRNSILMVEVPEEAITEERRTVEVLHIYADEDHAHMQKEGKQKGKENRMIPLVTVTEGTEAISKGRNRTIRPKYFVDENFDTNDLWKSVEGYLESTYNAEGIRKIYIHGDGGGWIRNGLDNFPQTVNVMDGYHFYKALKEISRILPKRNVRATTLFALDKDDRKRADRYIQELLNEELTEKEQEKIRQFGGYLFRWWEAIRTRVVEVIPGSCTEGQVSHILSERFSRDPMGWSKEVLGKLVHARVYLKNGGTLTKKAFRKETEKEEGYREYADRYIKEHLKGAFDFSLFDPIRMVVDGASGTQQWVQGLGRMRTSLIQ